MAASAGPYALTAPVAGQHWLFVLGSAAIPSYGGAPVARLGPVAEIICSASIVPEGRRERRHRSTAILGRRQFTFCKARSLSGWRME